MALTLTIRNWSKRIFIWLFSFSIVWLLIMHLIVYGINTSLSKPVNDFITTYFKNKTNLTLSHAGIVASTNGYSVTFLIKNVAISTSDKKNIVPNIDHIEITLALLNYFNFINPSIAEIVISGLKIKITRVSDFDFNVANYALSFQNKSTSNPLAKLGRVPWTVIILSSEVEYSDLAHPTQIIINPEITIANSAKQLSVTLKSSLPIQYGTNLQALIELNKSDATIQSFSLRLNNINIKPIFEVTRLAKYLKHSNANPNISFVLFGNKIQKQLQIKGSFIVQELENKTSLQSSFTLDDLGNTYSLWIKRLSVLQGERKVLLGNDIQVVIDTHLDNTIQFKSAYISHLVSHRFELSPFLITDHIPNHVNLQNTYFSGELNKVSIAFENGFASRMSMNGLISISEAAINDQYYITNTRLVITSVPGDIRIAVTGINVTLKVFELFPLNKYADSLSGILRVRSSGDNVSLISERITLQNNGSKLYGQLLLRYKKNYSPYLNLYLVADTFDGVTGLNSIPHSILNTQLSFWLTNSVTSGVATNFKLLYAGNLLYSLPSAGPEVLEINFDFHSVSLRYQSQWPIVKSLVGRFNFANNSLRIIIDDSMIYTMHTKGTIEITDFKQVVLHATLHVSGSATEFKEFVLNSPLTAFLGKFVNTVTMEGQFKSLLAFSIPILDPTLDRVALQGLVIPTISNCKINQSHITVSDVNGLIYYNEHSVYSDSISAQYDGERLETSIRTIYNNDNHQVVLEMKGRASLQALSGVPNIITTLGVHGKTNFTLDMLIPMRTAVLPSVATIKSNMIGISIQQSNQLQKKIEEVNPLLAQVYIYNDKLVITARLEKKASTTLSFLKQAGQFQLASGVITLGEGMDQVQTLELLSKQKLDINAKLSKIGIDPWLELKNAASASLIPIPIILKLKSEQLFYNNYIINNNEMKCELSSQTQFNCDLTSTEIDGAVLKTPNQPLTFLITRLVIGNRNLAKKIGFSKFRPTQLPAFVMDCAYCQYQDKIFRDTKIYNSPQPNGALLTLIMQNKITDYLGKVQWLHDENTNSDLSRLEFNISSKNMGGVMSDIGFPQVLEKGEGTAKIKLAWSAPLFSIDINTLSGDADFDLKSGVLKSISQNEAQNLLSILNITQIPNRILFDFDDISKHDNSDTIFDHITSSFTLSQGVASTSNAKIQGSFGSITLFGTVDFNEQRFNLNALVIPNISDALPIITGFLGGLPLLLGSLIINKAVDSSGKSVNTLGAVNYSVTGNFNNPTIVKVEKK
ncbi:MAG: AsmA-like C-terminal region-containing protein [Methylacidiphilales bacterium]|nr:AsmA-like C-terminal region-containing protein [Candidatus Methylacidiphilales bacterium]